ncbi:MAG TPA: PSD1 and planctomycete cytochrome C domain-containing protein [Planctomycetaceae bacterium]|nr:PSD1 and planctomycete cytochrome C domain-containing protein [Planctomycetaceae bacterium]HQZ65241.1 PSD1 and planctomycete cytochrome C domain-containing protein [Planctomycetaceae bacterium]
MRCGLLAVRLAFVIALIQPTIADEQKSVAPDHPERAKKGLALFKASVRTTLTKHCLDCHGGKSVKGDFDLSTRELLMDSGFVTESADDSHLMQLITHAADPHMPFKAPKLADAEIEQIGNWINLGSPYDSPLADKSKTPALEMQVKDSDREFWSFRPLQPVTPPIVQDTAWCRTPIDQFVRAKQEAVKLTPNATADRRILIRRAYFGLLGLPPTPDEVDSFVNDSAEDAWPKLIDGLLESPQYGERWARHWMDVARFAESHGYEQDYDRPNAYHYRDFLIRALNADLPYDKFVQWQLAGDELAPNDPLAMMATGFLGAGAFPTQLTEAEFESARYDELDDMVMTTGVAFLGLSIGCARCHDHKFDPIPSRDYYRMAATFSNAIRSETEVDLSPDQNRKRQADFDAELVAKKQAMNEYQKTTLPAKFGEWLTKEPVAVPTGPWETLHIVSIESSSGTKLERQADSSILATGTPPAQDVITIVAESYRPGIHALRVEALTHDSLPQKGPGRAGNGNFVLSDLKIGVQDGLEAHPTVGAKITAARATHQQNADSLSVAASFDSDPSSGWAVDAGGIGKDQAAVFDLELPVEISGAARWTIILSMNHPNPNHSLGHFRLSVSDQMQPSPDFGSNGPDSKVLHALEVLRKSIDDTSDEWKTGLAWFATRDAEMVSLQQSIRDLEKQGPGLQMAKVMVTSEGLPHMSHHADDRGFPHFYPETHLLKRGDVHQKQEVVTAGFLHVLAPASVEFEHWQVKPPEGWTRTSFRRATLANWMTDPKEGAGSLAARVMVNRLWQHHFGRGIVSTPNDFGVSGERPSHLELLDWLAEDMIEHGWTLKHMHKLIMTSQTYMQSGDHDEERALIDRENILLWRRTPQRLEAEAIRDSMLAVAGKLDLTQFGPGTLDQNMTRRSIYFFIKRSQLIPMMMLFDWPEHLVSIGQRPVTTIAPQALMFMNSPQGRDYAVAFAKRLPQDSTEQAVREAWRLAFGRVPSDAESHASAEFLIRQTKTHTAAGQTDAHQQAMIDLCQTLMSMNEFVYVE